VKIYVTGASGVIGSEVSSYFVEEFGSGCVKSISRRPCPTLPAGHPATRLVTSVFDGAWLDPEDVNATIVHCAGLSDPRRSFPNYAVLAKDEILPQIEMVEQLISRGWRGRMIYCSSGGTVYGDAIELPIRETHPQAPISAYGLHKLILERAFSQLAEERGFELVILRISNPYGSLVSKSNQGVIPILIRSFLNNDVFTVIGDGTAERDYLEIRDLALAMRRAAEFEMAGPVEVLNIGSGEKTSLNSIIDIVGGLAGKNLEVRYVPSGDEVKSNVLDCSKARKVLNWQPTIALEAGIKELFERMSAVGDWDVRYQRA